MNSVNRVRPTVQFKCITACPFAYVRIVREPGKGINHIPKSKAVVDRYMKMCGYVGAKSQQKMEG